MSTTIPFDTGRSACYIRAMLISIPHHTHSRAPWASWFHHCLSAISKKTDVPQFTETPRWYHGLTVDVSGKRVLIWTWDYSHGVRDALAHDIDLVLHCQYGDVRDARVSPWLLFPSDAIRFTVDLPGHREAARRQPILYALGWSGRAWRNRKRWISALEQRSDCDIICTHGQATNHGSLASYYERMGSYEYALSLAGKGSTGHMGNRREVECAALGVPLIMNYDPIYIAPFEAGEHFARAQTPEDAIAITQSGAGLSLAEAAREYYERNLTPSGICDWFRRVCEVRL